MSFQMQDTTVCCYKVYSVHGYAKTTMKYTCMFTMFNAVNGEQYCISICYLSCVHYPNGVLASGQISIIKNLHFIQVPVIEEKIVVSDEEAGPPELIMVRQMKHWQ